MHITSKGLGNLNVLCTIFKRVWMPCVARPNHESVPKRQLGNFAKPLASCCLLLLHLIYLALVYFQPFTTGATYSLYAACLHFFFYEYEMSMTHALVEISAVHTRRRMRSSP